MAILLSGDAYGRGAKVGELGLGHTGARPWKVSHLMTSAIATGPLTLAGLLCEAAGRQKNPAWSLTQEMHSMHPPSLCLPTDNNQAVKAPKDTGKQEMLIVAPISPLLARCPLGKTLAFSGL